MVKMDPFDFGIQHCAESNLKLKRDDVLENNETHNPVLVSYNSMDVLFQIQRIFLGLKYKIIKFYRYILRASSLLRF